MHIPVHSNAEPFNCSSPYNYDTFGTEAFYRTNNGSQLANEIRFAVGTVGPGTRDRILLKTGLGELNQTSAVAAYLEAEYHTFRPGMDFLHAYDTWSWRIPLGVDICRGYPRQGQGPTRAKKCSW
jgi:hypothetical protein